MPPSPARARKACPECDTGVGDDAPFCPRCGIDLAPSEARDERHAEAVRHVADLRRDAWRVTLSHAAAFAGFYWAPMFTVATPRWALLAETLLILLLSCGRGMDSLALYLSVRTSPAYRWGGRKSGWTAWLVRARKMSHTAKTVIRGGHVVSLSCVSAYAVMVFAPEWAGWRWAFPVAASALCLAFLFARFLNWVVP
jgi:hypothetical protein